MKNVFCKRLLVSIFGLLLPGVALADDTEIYLTSYAKAGQPNILFVLDSSGSMNNPLELSGTVARSRYRVMREVLEEVLASIPDTVNVGLLNYGGHKEKAQANGIRYPVTSLTPDPAATPAKDVRAEILAEIDRFEVEGYTPIVQSLYEAALYFRGEAVDYGASGTLQRLAHPDTYVAASEPRIVEPGEGETVECNKTAGECPTTGVTLSCTKRYEFFCAVGVDCPAGIEARSDCRLVDVPASTYEEEVCRGGYDEAGNCSNIEKVTRTIAAHQNYECLTEMCSYQDPGDTRFQVDNATYRSPIRNECQANYLVLMSDGEPDDGLSLDAGDPADSDPVIIDKLRAKFGLNRCATTGDGRCGSELTDFLANTDQMPGLEGKQTIATYTIAFAVEEKGKQYLQALANLGKTADPDGTRGFFSAENRAQLKEVFNAIVTRIAVVNHDLAIPSISVDPETGLTHGKEVFFPFFRPGISPRWLGNLKKYELERDGDEIRIVDATGRPIYDDDGNPVQDSRGLWLPADAPADGGDIAAGGAAGLLGDGRKIFTTNEHDLLVPIEDAEDEPAWFGGGDAKALVAYAKGETAAGGQEFRREMGDILHSSPVIVPFENGSDLIFVGTNEGFLHAIDTKSGREKFAFIPRALLPVLKIRKENAFDQPHPYGLDGHITVWRDDRKLDANDQPTGKTLLAVGMRRGGLNYYVLDITDPDDPKLAWVLRGGDLGTAGFEDLGQTWSRMLPATVHIGGKLRPAFIFSGGYDPDYDQPDPEGRFAEKIRGGDGDTLFIVDARSGEKIWQADFGGEAAGIVANPRVVDIDNNGIADRIYLVDIEGGVFRIDLPDPSNSLMLQKVSEPRIAKLADLGSNGSGVHRRFYNEPDAALVVDDGQRYVSLAIGSGYRAHPLMKGRDIDQDYLFVIKDVNLYQLPPGPNDKAHRLIIPADLTSIGGSVAAPAGGPSAAPRHGWKLALNKQGGEKALAKAVTLKNTVYFTTFEPETKPAADICSNASHTGRIYGLDIRSGRPALKFVDIEEPKQSIEFTTSDIPSEVVLVASKYETAVGGGKVVKGVKFDILDAHLKGLESPTFSGLNKWYWEARE